MSTLKEILSAPQAGQFGLTLMHFVWQGALVAALLAGALRLLRKRSASVRYIVATAALLTLAVAPVVTLLSMEGAPARTPAAEARVSDAGDSQPIASHTPPPVRVESEPAPAVRTIPLVESVPLITTASALEVEPVTKPTLGWGQRVETIVQPGLPYVVGAWMLGVFVLLLWRLAGWTVIRRLTHRSVLPVPAELQAQLAELAGRLRVTRPVRLLISGIAVVPSVIGWFRPVILLPVAALSGLTPEQLETILAHELAHVRRHDYLVNTIQIVIETLLFYHPAVWWISNVIRAEREDCCDDLAVAVCGNRIAYARALTAMEELRAAPAPGLAATGGKLLARIRRIVGQSDGECRRDFVGPVLAILTVAIILVAAGSGWAQAADKSKPTKEPKKPLAENKSGAKLLPEDREVLAKLKKTVTTIKLQGEPLSGAVDFLRNITDVNILHFMDEEADDPDPAITIQLKNVTALRALDAACDLSGMAWRVNKGVIEIGPPAIIKGHGKPISQPIGDTKIDVSQPVVGNK